VNHVIVNDMKVVEIEPEKLTDEAGEECVIVMFDDAYGILDAWMHQDPARRNFRYSGDDSSADPCGVTIMWIANDVLIVQDLDPFWSPSTDIVNGYDLDELDASLPIDTLKYGADIGEQI
jgi:hypothetical protein